MGLSGEHFFAFTFDPLWLKLEELLLLKVYPSTFNDSVHFDRTYVISILFTCPNYFSGVFTRESMKNYKSLDAHIFFKSGWVHTIYSYKPNTSTVTVLKANVVPSWRVNDEPHHPWVAVTKDGTISSAHCDCKAG